MLTHGIGSNLEWQKERKRALKLGIEKVIRDKKHFASKYQIVLEIINWKKLIEEADHTKDLAKCRIHA